MTRRLGWKAAWRIGATTLALFGAIAFLRAVKAQALPRYSARYEQNCLLCHANPAGGGMRSTYASQELVPKELAWTKATPQAMKAIDPQISKSVVIGADFREMYLATDLNSTQPIGQGFFQMQQSVYLQFQLDPKITLYVDRGASDTYEMFGTAYLLPHSGYLKAGRFVPAYGWKFDDHTMFVRSELGFMPPASNDVGVEIGMTPEKFDLQLAVVNGTRGAVSDNDGKPAEALTGVYRFRAGPAGIGAGLHGYHQPGRTQTLDMGGAHGYLTYASVTWVGQADWRRRDPTSGPTLTGFVTSHELSVLLHRGLDAVATYDFIDPDLDLESGARTRYGIGLHSMPHPFIGFDVLYRRIHDDTPNQTDIDSNEGVFLLHLLF